MASVKFKIGRGSIMLIHWTDLDGCAGQGRQGILLAFISGDQRTK